MKKWLIPILIFLIFSCRESESIPITELADIKLENAVLLDVRTAEEYDSGHLEGALNINWYDEDFSEQLISLDRSKTVYVYCKAGGRSAKAAALMREMGFDHVVNLEGGYDAFTPSTD